MPLWYHPPAVPVNLGAPVFPGPLMYHPAPILVDPRPQHPCDTLYCACQFSVGPAPAQWWSGAAQPAVSPLPSRTNALDQHGNWVGLPRLRREVETEWVYEVKRSTGPTVDVAVERSNTGGSRRLNIRLSGGHLHTHLTTPSNPGTEKTSTAAPFDEATTERIRAEIRRDLERVNEITGQAPLVQPKIATTDQVPVSSTRADQHLEKEKLEKMRDEIRKEMAAEYEEKTRALEARELDIQRRMDEIKMREAQWIKDYGEGVIKGQPAACIRRQPPLGLAGEASMLNLRNIGVGIKKDEVPAPIRPDEAPALARPMRWLFRDSELKSYHHSPSLINEGCSSSSVESTRRRLDELFASHPSIGSPPPASESTSDSVRSHVAYLTRSEKPTGLVDKVIEGSDGKAQSEAGGEVNGFRAVSSAEGPDHNHKAFNPGPSSQPWKWFGTGANEKVPKVMGMGPTFNISSLVSNPGGAGPKDPGPKIPDLCPVIDMTELAQPNSQHQHKPSISSCTSSYTEALMELTMDGFESTNENPKPITGIKNPSNGSLEFPRDVNTSKNTQTSTLEEAAPSEHDRPFLRSGTAPFLVDRGAGDASGRPSAGVRKPVPEAPRAPVRSTEPSPSDTADETELIDRDFSFCEPFYDWSVHNLAFTMPEIIALDGSVSHTVHSQTAPGIIDSGDTSDISSNLFSDKRYMMGGAKESRKNMAMTGELKWPPSPTVKTISTTSSSVCDQSEVRGDQNTALEPEADLLLGDTNTTNPYRIPKMKDIVVESSHILDESPVFDSINRELYSPPLTPSNPAMRASPILSEGETVFKLPPSTTGHELTITVSRSTSSTSASGSSQKGSQSEDGSIAALLRGQLEGVAAERSGKRVKSVHWGACTEAQRRFAASEGMSYYVLSDQDSEVANNWSDGGSVGYDGHDDYQGDDEQEDCGYEQEEEEEINEKDDDASSICESQAPTVGVRATLYG